MLSRAITDITLKDDTRLQRGAAANTTDQLEICKPVEIAVDRHLADGKKLSKLLDGRRFAGPQQFQNAAAPRLSH